jgi:hypothetical protein
MSEREMRAFALAPLPVLALALVLVVTGSVAAPDADALLIGLIGIVFLALFLYGAVLLIGLPIHLLLRRLRKTALVHYLGLVVLPILLLGIGFMIWVRRTLKPLSVGENPFSLSRLWANAGLATTLTFAAIAALSASTFWYAGVRKPKT